MPPAKKPPAQKLTDEAVALHAIAQVVAEGFGLIVAKLDRIADALDSIVDIPSTPITILPATEPEAPNEPLPVTDADAIEADEHE